MTIFAIFADFASFWKNFDREVVNISKFTKDTHTGFCSKVPQYDFGNSRKIRGLAGPLTLERPRGVVTTPFFLLLLSFFYFCFLYTHTPNSFIFLLLLWFVKVWYPYWYEKQFKKTFKMGNQKWGGNHPPPHGL